MSNKELSNEESLALITEMIGQAKRNLAKGGSFYFLLWGWVIMLANLGHYLIAVNEWYEHPYIVWLLVIPAVVITLIYSAREQRKSNIRSHMDRLYGVIWIAVFVSIMITLVFMSKLNYNNNAVILLMAGIGTFISGSALRFIPLTLGGVALWITGIIAFNLSPIDQYLVASIGILIGYLVPGYLLKRAEK